MTHVVVLSNFAVDGMRAKCQPVYMTLTSLMSSSLAAAGETKPGMEDKAVVEFLTHPGKGCDFYLRAGPRSVQTVWSDDKF